MRRSILVKLGPLILVFLAAGVLPGCSSGGIAEPASPVTHAESEAAKKAREQDEQLRLLRTQQEAKARKRVKGLPEEG
ncbi:hypothetical protein [Singulisphaera acidiphila]|uniref:Uncharacterized protein n=1 Tax=Singulisphaera acidiphila (strain ATCC BAA-1392 / DSM 18658 / VKM B-2454 / MOB10) TaxID=886293 RepID=L0DS10_SINAD|nr:hypothetical protein [Singulisphaera acidiphila]AGA31186.1 hypothetical protein Sinac_7132 [Singulisphaera acidiphila DSM 18658]